MNEFHSLLQKTSLSEEEQITMKRLREDIDILYIDMVKGAFIRSSKMAGVGREKF